MYFNFNLLKRFNVLKDGSNSLSIVDSIETFFVQMQLFVTTLNFEATIKRSSGYGEE